MDLNYMDLNYTMHSDRTWVSHLWQGKHPFLIG